MKLSPEEKAKKLVLKLQRTRAEILHVQADYAKDPADRPVENTMAALVTDLQEAITLIEGREREKEKTGLA